MRKGILVYKRGSNEDCYGIIGKNIGEFDMQGEPLHIGDLVLFRLKDSRKFYKGLIVESDFLGSKKVGVMGAVSSGINSDNFDVFIRVLPHYLLTEEISYNLHKFNIIKPRKMTIKEIEKELGYPIEIIEGDNIG